MNMPLNRSTVLVTGGAGYIGSHTCLELIRAGYDVVVVDDFSTGSLVALDRVESITGVFVRSYRVDIRDEVTLGHVFEREDIAAVIHFAAKKAVGESTEIPLEYFDDNVGGTATLLKVMEAHGVHRLVFSSSCSIYGNTSKPLLDELSTPAPANPYAWTKLACEEMVAQACHYNPELRATALRYFNPIGAHPSGLLGEDPTGTPRNVMPYLTQVAQGSREFLPVFGDDYPTPDGSAVRDYIHVLDVARGHLDALAHLDDEPEMQLFNLGTGVGTSVLELCSTLARVTGREVPVQVQPRRDGDVPRLVADTSKVRRAWEWTTRYSLADMCRDAWNFQQHNPGGYSSAWKAVEDSSRPSGFRAA